jgi:hypothetical protein
MNDFIKVFYWTVRVIFAIVEATYEYIKQYTDEWQFQNK